LSKKSKAFVLSLFLCITLLSLTFVGFVQALTYESGVESGMVFDYTLDCYWSSSDPNYSEVPTDLLVYNFTAYVEVRISEVNHTHVTVANPWYFKDGTSY
jgi:hypothetical protein